MIWLWIQSLLLLTATFALGLWLGNLLSMMTGGRRSAPASATFLLDEDSLAPSAPPTPVYYGAEPMPDLAAEPEPVPAVAEPAEVIPLRPEPPAEPPKPEPQPQPQPEPEPIIMPVPVEPPRPQPIIMPVPMTPVARVRVPLLFPINQFGVISITQAPA